MRWIADSGHAWLEVPAGEAANVPGISSYSYRHPAGELVYLEEDCDAGKFARHYGVELRGIPSVYVDGYAELRNFPRY